MLVSAAPFYVFLVAVCMLYWAAAGSRRLQLAVLVAANLFFLARFSLIYLALPLAASADFLVGLGLDRSRKPAIRRLLLGVSLAINLGLLVGLKLVPLLTAGRFAWLFTLSLSFYCFQSLTYTIDLYLGEIRPTHSYLAYLASALFFPSMTAGPIPHTGKLLDQFSRPFAFSREDGGRALLLIGIGLVKKLLIADYLANNLVGRVFDTPALYSSVETLIGVYGYALQLFFDFSGYTDIAIGVALLLGIRLPENFRRPYLSVNVAEFWHRWHITFSNWLFVYLFDILPKRRKHPLLSYSYAALVTMTLGGLWHGISWNFLIWGVLHGLALGVVFAWKLKRKFPSRFWWAKVLGGLATFHFVCFTWIFFRATSVENALAILRSLGALTWSVDNLTPLVLGVMLLAAVLHSLPPRWFDISVEVAARTPFWAQGLAMAALILLIQTLAGRGSAPFVYGNFNFSQTDSDEPGPNQPGPGPAGDGTGFPLKTALAILVLVGALAGWREHMGHGKGLDPGIFMEAFRLRWPQPPASVVPKTPTMKGNEKLPPVSAVFVDDSNSLDPFFAGLWKLEQGNLGQGKTDGVVTILHYGDSPTTADLITGDVRAQLQSRFGDAGRGYTLIAKPWAWYGHRGVEISDHGWKIRTAVGLMREGIYGLGGAAFEGQSDAGSKFSLTESQQTAVDVEYLAKPGGGTFAVEADDRRIVEQTTGSETLKAASVHVELPPGTKTVSIRPTVGTVTLFGADFRRGASGLLYDSLGLNGATTTVLARVLQPVLWQQELERAAPALVIVNYGSNESSFAAFVHKQYAAELRLAIQRLRQVAPGVPVLVMSPMDRGERSGLDEIKTMSTIPEIVAIQRQVAAETHCAFFDTYDAMGGDGTMTRWYGASPRLVTADLLHPTPQGATIVAGLFVEQLGLGYNRWKMQHGIALPAVNPAIAPEAGAGQVLPQPKQAVTQTGKKVMAH